MRTVAGASAIAFGTQRATTEFPRSSWLVAGSGGFGRGFGKCRSEIPQPLKGYVSVWRRKMCGHEMTAN